MFARKSTWFCCTNHQPCSRESCFMVWYFGNWWFWWLVNGNGLPGDLWLLWMMEEHSTQRWEAAPGGHPLNPGFVRSVSFQLIILVNNKLYIFIHLAAFSKFSSHCMVTGAGCQILPSSHRALQRRQWTPWTVWQYRGHIEMTINAYQEEANRIQKQSSDFHKQCTCYDREFLNWYTKLQKRFGKIT